MTPHQRFLAEPRRYRFDAGVRVLMLGARSADPADVARFQSASGLAYAASDIMAAEPARGGRPPCVVTPVMALTGPTGVLPRVYTETVAATLRKRSRALHDFIDLLGHRFVAHFARAGIKYRLHRATEAGALVQPPRPDPFTTVLLALTGYATGHLLPRLAVGPMPLLHYAGYFAERTRSADRLAAMLGDWLGAAVQVVQFSGAWLAVPPDQRTRMPSGLAAGAFNRLGHDAAIGERCWDLQARVLLRLGPLDAAAFNQLLPDRRALRELVSLVRAYLGLETGFAVNLVLLGGEVPPLRLDAAAGPPPRLGWNTWMPVAAGRRHDAPDPIFEAEVVEAATPATSGDDTAAGSLFGRKRETAG